MESARATTDGTGRILWGDIDKHNLRIAADQYATAAAFHKASWAEGKSMPLGAFIDGGGNSASNKASNMAMLFFDAGVSLHEIAVLRFSSNTKDRLIRMDAGGYTVRSSKRGCEFWGRDPRK
jgi:hypothetical protein